MQTLSIQTLDVRLCFVPTSSVRRLQKLTDVFSVPNTACTGYKTYWLQRILLQSTFVTDMTIHHPVTDGTTYFQPTADIEYQRQRLQRSSLEDGAEKKSWVPLPSNGKQAFRSDSWIELNPDKS